MTKLQKTALEAQLPRAADLFFESLEKARDQAETDALLKSHLDDLETTSIEVYPDISLDILRVTLRQHEQTLRDRIAQETRPNIPSETVTPAAVVTNKRSTQQEDSHGYHLKNLLTPKTTTRSLVFGFFAAIFMCAINSYLTLSFGVIEEGPTIVAIFFFAFFLFSRTKITRSEMVIVATMGSAGGSLGFFANFSAARAMVGTPFTIPENFLFALVSSLVGLLAVIPLRTLLIVQDEKLPPEKRLPWVGAKAVKGVIDSLTSMSEKKQATYLWICLVLSTLYVIFNEEGVGITPFMSSKIFFGLAAFGACIVWTPFLFGASYLMGLRTCVGFLVGGAILIAIAPWTSSPANPAKFIWPGVMFLTTSGITAILINWRMLRDSFKSLISLGKKSTDTDKDPILTKRQFAILGIGVLIFTTLCLNLYFQITLLVIAAMIIMGGLVLNVIATRAAAQTYFNPARVMGVFLEMICAGLGLSSASQIVTGGGFVAGAGSQGGNLTSDMAYGRWYKTPSRIQFWVQAITIPFCCLTTALVFHLINSNTPITLDGKLGPIGKMWAGMALLFDPSSGKELSVFAIKSMWVGGIAGIIYTLLESKEKIGRWMPGSIGIGLGMVLFVGYDFGFFIGGIVMCLILPKIFKIRAVTLNTLAVGMLVGEGLGGISQALLKAFGIIVH